MSRLVLNFPLNAADQARIDPTSIQITNGVANYPDSVQIRFTIVDPANGAPKLRPLFASGQVSFQGDVAGGLLPPPTHPFTWTTAEYRTWRTLGTLMVDADPTVMTAAEAIAGRPDPIPNRAWYWPVRLSQGFLYGTVRTRTLLKHGDIRKAAGGKSRTTDADWPGYAVSGFLDGSYSPSFRKDPADQTLDDIHKIGTAMPEVIMDPVSGLVELHIAAAVYRKHNFLDDD